MKKLLAFIATMLYCMTAFAQQALWGGSQIVSPEINPDNSVTFRLRAPKAVRVQVIGDFTASGPADLIEKEGIWENFLTLEKSACEILNPKF